MLNFIQNERTKLIVVASVAGIFVVGAAISLVKSCSSDEVPKAQATLMHYTCAACGNRWQAEFSSDPKCPKCQGAGFVTYWAMCPTCQKPFKTGDIKYMGDKCEYRAPGSTDWVADPAALTNVCPLCNQVVRQRAMRPRPLEGWDPPQ
jgi:hypothetical protein